MRGVLILVAALAASSLAEGAPATHPAVRTQLVLRPVAQTPAQAPTLYAKLTPRLTRAGQDWIKQMSATLRSDELQPEGVRNMAGQVCRQMLSRCAGGGDIEALTFIILMQTAADEADDLKDMLADLKAINSRKAGLRRLRTAIDKTSLDAEIDKIKGDIDSQSGLGEMQAMRLQMAMDRLSRMMQTLSNLVKKVGDTDSGIIMNMK